MKIRPVGAELLHADGRTDRQTGMTVLTVAFRNSLNEPKNETGRASHDLQRREMRTHVSDWGDTGPHLGDNINMVIKVTEYSCANTVLYIRENVAGAWQKLPNEEFQNENKYNII